MKSPRKTPPQAAQPQPDPPQLPTPNPQLPTQQRRVIIIDPGHGLSNRTPGRYDPGTVQDGYEEATVVLHWAQDLHHCITQLGHRAHLTRAGREDPMPLQSRVPRARNLGGHLLISLHTNPRIGNANGTETFYRGTHNKTLAEEVNRAVVRTLGTNDRKAKTEQQLGHNLAILAFPKSILLELGFLGWVPDRVLLLDPALRLATCRALAPILIRHAQAPAT